MVAEALYFTPKASNSTFGILTNVAPIVLSKNQEKLKAVLSLAKKARALIGKRHGLIHNRFSLNGAEATA